jgi:predicted GIY-YIG superfamily endonuclease
MPRTREEKNAYCREWNRRNPEKKRQTYLAWREKHADRFNARRREYRAKNRATLQAQKEKWARENPDRVAATQALARLRRQRQQIVNQLRSLYDFTLADYEALLTAQAHRCGICGRQQGNDRGHRLFVDHDHTTGDIRGLLCNRCNSALGYFGDSAKRLRRAAAYLENWRGKTAPDSRRGFQPILGCLSETGSTLKRPEGVDSDQAVVNIGRSDAGGAAVAVPPAVLAG